MLANQTRLSPVALLFISENKRRAAQMLENDVITSDESIQCGVRVVRSDERKVRIGPAMMSMTTTTIIPVLMVGSMEFVSIESSQSISLFLSSFVRLFTFERVRARMCVYDGIYPERHVRRCIESKEEREKEMQG